MSKATKRPAGPERINPKLAALVVPIGRLRPDPENARLHPARNLEAIAKSLERFGQQGPVLTGVRGGRRVVVKGNGVLAAALALGWKRLAALDSDLDGPDVGAYAIADNRSTDLSEFDEMLLAAQLQALRVEDADLAALGFDEAELEGLCARALEGVFPPAPESEATPAGGPAARNDSGRVAGRAPTVRIQEFQVQKPPVRTWVLINIATTEYGRIADFVEQISRAGGSVKRSVSHVQEVI